MPARHDRRPGSDEQQQQDVADGVGEVHGDLDPALAGGLLNRAEGKRSAEGRGSEAGDRPIEPVGRRQPSNLAADQQHQRHVGEREEAQEQDIGERRDRRRRPADRFEGERQVTEAPDDQARAEDHRDSRTRCRTVTTGGDAEKARHELERAHSPTADPRRLGPVRLGDEQHHVAQQQQSHDAVSGPHGGPRPRAATECAHARVSEIRDRHTEPVGQNPVRLKRAPKSSTNLCRAEMLVPGRRRLRPGTFLLRACGGPAPAAD